MVENLLLCIFLGVPGVVDEDASCVPVHNVSDRVLVQLAPGGISSVPEPWASAVEDAMNDRTDDGLRPADWRK